MLQQKRNRVRISSQRNVINVPEESFDSVSKCSCAECDSISCFRIRNLNSAISCTCTDCNTNRCLSWHNKDEAHSTIEIKNGECQDIRKNLGILAKTNETESIHDGTNTDNKIICKKPNLEGLNDKKNELKSNMLWSFLDSDFQDKNINDSELKEKEEKKSQSYISIGKNNPNVYEVKPDFKRCCTSNQAFGNINCYIPSVKENTLLDNNDSKDQYDINISSRNASKEKCECKECCSSKDLANKICNVPDVKKSSTSIELKHKKKSSSYHSHCVKHSKSALPETKELFMENSEKFNPKNDLDDKNSDINEHLIPKSNLKKVSIMRKESPNTDSTKTNQNANTLKKIINLLDDVDPINDKAFGIDSGNFKRYDYKDVSYTEKKTIKKRNDKIYEKCVSRLQSLAVSYAPPDNVNSRAELSAQVMNVPLDEFKESLSRKQSSTNNPCAISNNLGKVDIFKRLKEIYEACSCKVCECLPGKSIFNRNEICNCEPCHCEDCMGVMEKLRNRLIENPHSGCPCVACDRKDCRGVVKDVSGYASCECEPCECVKFSNSFTKPCSCTPCQCDICKQSIFIPQTLKVANVAEHRTDCDCEPCECQNCTGRYSAMTSNRTRESPTEMITHGSCNCASCPNDSCQLGRSDCRCDVQNKVMRKPIANNSPDYSIHRVYIKEKQYGQNTTSKKNHDTIAMFALSNTYSNRLFNSSNKKESCQCEVCECIVCKDKGKVMDGNEFVKLYTKSLNSCKCSPCECETCKKYNNSHKENLDESFCVRCRQNSIRSNKNFEGVNISNDNYNTIIKAKPTYSLLKVNSIKSRECANCFVNLNSNDIEDSAETNLEHDCYILKKGKLLTPSMFELNSARDSSQINIKTKDDSHNLNADGLKSNYAFEQKNASLMHQIKTANTYNNFKSNGVVDSIEKIFLGHIVSKEKETAEILNKYSMDLMNNNVSKISCGYLNNNIKDDRNTVQRNKGVRNKNMEFNNGNIKKTCKTRLFYTNEVSEKPSKIMSIANSEIQFASARSMSLVKLLCRERNIDIDNTQPSLEKIPLKIDKKLSYLGEKTSNDNCYNCFEHESQDSYGYDNSEKFNMNMERKNSKPLNCGKQNIDMINSKIKKYEIPHINSMTSHYTKTNTEQLKPTEIDLQMVKRRTSNYKTENRIRRRLPLVEINKPRSNKTEGANIHLKTETENEIRGYDKQVKNKRHLELPFLPSHSSVIKINASDKLINFYDNLPLQQEIADSDRNKKGSSVLKKTFYVSPGIEQNIAIPSFELDLKNPIKSISQKTSADYPCYLRVDEKPKALSKIDLETMSKMTDATSQTRRINIAIDKEVNCNLMPSTENIQQNVQGPLDRTLTKAVKHSTIDARDQYFEPNSYEDDSKEIEKGSCDGLKATFVFLRKVSDHTVLLRWKMPRNTKDIRGYELQVDGRPVKQILNPSRCMAVLTCLPHGEKLLLNIRTITKHDTCHNPVTTVVYNPKKVKSGLL